MLILYIFLIPVASVYTICTGKPEPTCGQNASYVDCPTACPATCKSPNEGNCNKKCEPKGCRCNPSYLLSKPKGECILPKDCPGGNPCPQNETFVACNIGCPTNYCPVDDSLAILICDPAWQCPSGCFCKQNYKRKSIKDPRCILASECPRLKCTRPNEEWNSCTNSCLRENCYQLKEKHISCKPWGCEPRCACKHGYYRNDSRICVPASQCFPEETCEVKPECKRTCAQPNPENCSYETVTENVKGCKCKPGFILSDMDGDCIEIEKCPQQLGCNNDPNAVVTSCPPPCPATCQSPRDAPCKKMCLDVGCRCKNGFILSKLNGLCVKPENCTGGDPCGKNATFSSCSNRCPYNYCPKDDSPTNYDCLPESPCPAGCICKLNHRRKSQVDDQCILASDCPSVNCTRPNEVWHSCPSACLKENCKDSGKKPTVCNTLVLNCQPQCVCKPNTYRDKNKVCVPVDKCPAPPPIKCGVNEEYSKCKIKCPPQFCNNSYTDYGICPNDTKCEPGCNCIMDHLRDFEGKCVLNDNCPPPPTPCGGNATSTDCASACPPTCDTPKPEICIDLCEPNVTCQCMPSYVLSPNGDCILPEDCPDENCMPFVKAPPPPVCSKNEVSIVCKTRCTSDLCDSEKPKGICRPGPCRRGCICKEGYARDSNGKCIPKEKCPKIPTPCGANATNTDCASSCPPTCQTPKPGICPAVCKPNVQCKCKPSYVLSPKGDCILPQDCPAPCGGNKTYTDCASSCPPTCETPKPGVCAAVCKPNVTCQCKPSYVLSPNGDCTLPEDCPAPPIPVCSENEVSTICKTWCTSDSCDSEKPKGFCRPGPCRRGCICKEGYARDASGKCIPKYQCPAKPITCGGNATLVECTSACPPTCGTPKPEVCIALCKPKGCQCKPSYVLSPIGDCILPQDCPAPTPCGGNATHTDCASSCPPTCQTPKPGICPAVCKPNVKCKCKPSYVLSPKGDCILPQDCPAPCGGNKTYTDCASSCPPTCESPQPGPCVAVCKPNVTCQCKPSYVLSPNGDCILPEDCPAPPPPVCGENEVSIGCKTWCTSDSCDTKKPKDFCRPGPCRRGCICKEGYARDASGKCIPKYQCPKTPTPCGGNATHTDCASSCPLTCQSPKPVPCISLCKPNVTCQCKPGYVLSPNGDCILLQDCPAPPTCGGNATLVDCASSCPSTCQTPDPQSCIAKCISNSCQCKPSYILSKPKGECILPVDCPGGTPCSQNATFLSCNVRCPNSYCPVDDRQGIIMCDPPRPCRSGCSCKLNYKLKSIKEPQCILAEECPPVKCTRPNEEWNTCPTSCLKENCEDLKLRNTACKPSRTNCQPRCACKEGFYRNSSRICVPASECFPSKKCDIPEECKATCAEPNPKNCPYQPATENVEGCKCKPGYVLSDKNGECIRIEECPVELGCNGDSNAVVTKCPPPCPSTCDSPNETPCKKSCLPVGCKCKDGFILSKLNGLCIKPENCTGGNPCKNGVFSTCNNKCPYNYCPINDSPPDYNCTATSPCRSGCICRFNHRKKSVNDEQCILASDCPPVNCTRPNEEWDSCPSACLNEGCENAGKKTPICYTLIYNCDPRCVCKPNTYRDKNKVCVPVDQCPTPPVVCGENEVETCKYDDDDTELCVCKPTCDCKENYSRDSNGKCVPDIPCPPKSCDVPPECRRTCAKPNPKNCSSQEVSENENGCKCKPGYILLDKHGECVKIEKCPSDLGCNGDINALVSQCPPPCPSTCSGPNEILCRKACLDVGCKCKEGFILSQLNGLCIPPDECKGGNPCGKNATFSSCSNRCSYNYCPKDDSPPNYNCSLPYRCPSGCVCNLNYRRKSIDDRQCILASECPPVNCTRPNEVWDSCPSDCLQEKCEDAGKPEVPCDTYVLNCQPKCVCKKNTYRNKDKICVPVNKCPKKKPIPCDPIPINY